MMANLSFPNMQAGALWRGALYIFRTGNKKQSFQNVSRVMLTFTKTYLHPTWKLHFRASKYEIESLI